MNYLRLAGLAAAALAALWLANVFISHGYNKRVIEDAKKIERKVNEANRADDRSTRCSRDPECRLRDDGYRRD